MIKQNYIPHRNITPNLIRYRRKNSQTKTPSQQQNGQPNNTQRKQSKASDYSLQVYENRMLNISKLKFHFNLQKPRTSRQFDPSHKKALSLDTPQRSNTNDKNNFVKQSMITLTQRTNDASPQKKRSAGLSGPNLRTFIRNKYFNQKQSQTSLEKQEHQARLMNDNLIRNLMTMQNNASYINKLKIRKNQYIWKHKTTNKKILNCNIQIKNQQTMKFYQIFGQLGKGAYGLVKMGVDKRKDEKIALKVYDKKKLNQFNKIQNLQRQINILSSLNYHTIAKLIQTIETPTEIYLILEYGGANSLYHYLLSKPQHRMLESQAKKFFKTIAQTLQYLHNLNIVHRDIKAENILLNRYKQLKLIDFGFSIECKPSATIDTFCGTPTYMAPQIVSKREHVPIFTDMWSLGVLLYVMLQGNYPFIAKTEEQLFQKIKKGHFEYIHSDISHRAKFLISSLIRVNPLQRLTIKEVLSEENIRWYDSM